MSPYISADLIISGVMIIVGIGFVITGLNQKKLAEVKSNFASPNTSIVIGILLVVFQLSELFETYM